MNATTRMVVTSSFAINFTFNSTHLKRSLWPSHGPQTWPWWKLFSPKFFKLDVTLPSTGYRLWVYSRWGAIHFDAYIDRRSPQQRGRL